MQKERICFPKEELKREYSPADTPLCQKVVAPLNLFMEKKKIFSEMRSARKKVSLLNPLNLVMGIH